MKLNKKNIVKKYPLTQNIFVLLDKISRLRRKGEKNTYFCVKKFGYLKKKYYLCSQFTSGVPRKEWLKPSQKIVQKFPL